MKKKKNVTMQDIGDQLGISKVTVSKALNDKEGVSEDLRANIKKVASELGYRRANLGQACDEGNTIAVVVRERYVSGTKYDSFYLKFYQMISASLNKRGYMCNLFTLKAGSHLLPDLILDAKVSGIIILGQIRRTCIEQLMALSVPIVFLDSYDLKYEIDSILADNYYISYKLTSYLLKNGHRDIGFIGNIYSTSSIQDRYMGYCRALLEAKIHINEQWVVSDRDENSNEIPFQLPDKLPSAFVCNCDGTAYRFINYLKKTGYRVPGDISVVGFDDDIYAKISDPQLTTVGIDMETMTEKSTNQIINLIENGPSDEAIKVFVTGRIVYRDSVKNISEDSRES